MRTTNVPSQRESDRISGSVKGSGDDRPQEFWLGLRIPLFTAFLFYCVFALLLYWPVLFGKRFFWEDFFTWEYPIRDYCYYMFGLKHLLPFWNPYNWNVPAVLADGQNGFWYPTNILAIFVTRIVAPGQSHLAVIVPEVLTIAHLPMAALGLFVLLKKHFHVSDAVALIAGVTFGFGSRIVGDQNHPMWVYQLALLPWATLLYMRSWDSWRSTIGLGLILGIGFLAGHPQVFLFTSFFFLCFTFSEVIVRVRESGLGRFACWPVASFAIAMTIACGLASIQLLPSLELAGMSARAQLSYFQASAFALHPGGLIVFLVPKMFAEGGDPSSTGPTQPIFYWSMLAETLALFAVLGLWKRRRDRGDARTRHLRFAVIFSLFAIAFGVGAFLPVHWVFWKWVPLFNKVRAPARMMWFLWLLGTIYGGIGLEMFLMRRSEIKRSERFFIGCAALLVIANLLAASGILDILFLPRHTIRPGLPLLLLPSVGISLLVATYLVLAIRGKISRNLLFLLAGALILSDLYYNGFTQHRNTVSRDRLTEQDVRNSSQQGFFRTHAQDHAKLLWLRNDTPFKFRENVGMILRRNIEDADDSDGLLNINPMRLARSFPPVADSVRRLEIMGVAGILTGNSELHSYPNALPFVRLYYDWRVIPNDSIAERAYSDTTFDFQQTIVLDEPPGVEQSAKRPGDSAALTAFSENKILVTVNATAPSVLLINDLYYPAWHATVDGTETNILRAFTSLRAIPIGAGVHRVELRYDDAAFDLGWKITLGTIGLSLLALCFGPKKKGLGLRQDPLTKVR